MLHLLRRHPIPIKAHFRSSLVLTFAFPQSILEPLLPPGLELDTLRDHGFVAIALVQTDGLRPSGCPRGLGRSFFLSGYRIFTHFTAGTGARIRGLRILRSDTDRRTMVFFGNALTHYRYRLARVELASTPESWRVHVRTPDNEADLQVSANLRDPAGLPSGSFFQSEKEARRFAGPLPYTFDYEAETHSIVMIKGMRENWRPRLVTAQVTEASFLARPPFDAAPSVLSSAYYLEDVPYRWLKGIRVPLDRNASASPLLSEDDADGQAEGVATEVEMRI